jgi:hypothetical protein
MALARRAVVTFPLQQGVSLSLPLFTLDAGSQAVASSGQDFFVWASAVFDNQQDFFNAPTANWTLAETIDAFGQVAKKVWVVLSPPPPNWII